MSPVALIPRLANQDIWDIHSLCTKMPINALFCYFSNLRSWRTHDDASLFLDRNYFTDGRTYHRPSFFSEGHFCGWLCPAGFFTEYLNKLVPKKLQIPFDKLDAKAIRYGFFTAFLLIPIFGLGNMTCAFCNFNIIQGIFGLVSLNADYLSVFATQLGWITLAWVLIFGVFSTGGRGYCNLFCPPGILSSIFHWGGKQIEALTKI